MSHPLSRLLWCLLAAALHYAACRLWATWYVPREVRVNDADITADSNLDTLRKAYHAKRTRMRAAVWLGWPWLLTCPY